MYVKRYTLSLAMSLLVVQGVLSQNEAPEMRAKKMKIEVWSDVACPFCYIGQEHLKMALSSFPERDYVEVVWRSFLLDPTLPEKTNLNLFESLSKSKGMPMNQVMDMTAYVRQMGQDAGLELNFEKVVPVSTRKAHLLLQAAKRDGKGPEMKARLFRAYFTEGADLCDTEVLLSLGRSCRLPDDVTDAALNGAQELRSALQSDIDAAGKLGIRGVPYFVFNGRYAVSGAQPVNVFGNTLEKAYNEWLHELPEIEKVYLEGAVCKPAGKCD